MFNTYNYVIFICTCLQQKCQRLNDTFEDDFYEVFYVQNDEYFVDMTQNETTTF